MGIVNSIYEKKMNLQQQRRKEALREAKHIARILGERFGAKEVILYGSLSQERYFDMASDIDIVAKGLGDQYLKAYGYCLRLSKFNLDIRAYEDLPDQYKKKVNEEGRCLYAKKGK